jgi:predicted RNase H-like nuclease (RuvC/YqgF family)
MSETTDTDRELEQLRRERARLWEQLHEQRAAEREVEHLEAQIARMEASLSWRITWPLRLVKTYWHKVKRRLNPPD